MNQDEIIEMARHIASTFGTRMCDENGDTHGEELYAMGLDDIVDTIKLVDAKATAKEREACEAIEYDLAKSPAMFSTMGEYKAYKDGVQDYRAKIIARGEAT